MENSIVPYVLQLKDAVNAIHLSENGISSIGLSFSQPAQIAFVPSYTQTVEQICIQSGTEILEKIVDTNMEVVAQNSNEQVNFVYEVVHPEELNLIPVVNLKRGRPKKKNAEEPPKEQPQPKPVKNAPRTRSGRVIRIPKHIEKDFKKIETEDNLAHPDEDDVKVSEFVRFEDEKQEAKKERVIQLEYHQRKRKISGRYLCPKCKKAYLGKTKMIQHLKKYPDHGPLPHNELNFDVWNYLVDITQKCSPAERGIKFCEELTNLLHNVMLLTSALFKEVETNKNFVNVDKVLGNAIGLLPGLYKFNEDALYKDVTVLKLISNSDFFKPVNTNQESDRDLTSKSSAIKPETENVDLSLSASMPNNTETNTFSADNAEKSETKPDLYFSRDESSFTKSKVDNPNDRPLCIPETPNTNDILNNFEKGSVQTNFINKSQMLDNRLSVHTDLLSENSLLNLPNLRNSVDELIMSGVDSGTNLLDNSTSSDEVMNVDQFVNERFKKITEPEIGINGAGINLDLPSLDLFQFHTS